MATNSGKTTRCKKRNQLEAFLVSIFVAEAHRQLAPFAAFTPVSWPIFACFVSQPITAVSRIDLPSYQSKSTHTSWLAFFPKAPSSHLVRASEHSLFRKHARETRRYSGQISPEEPAESGLSSVSAWSDRQQWLRGLRPHRPACFLSFYPARPRERERAAEKYLGWPRGMTTTPKQKEISFSLPSPMENNEQPPLICLTAGKIAWRTRIGMTLPAPSSCFSCFISARVSQGLVFFVPFLSFLSFVEHCPQIAQRL